MKYGATIKLLMEWIPNKLQCWLNDSLPTEMTYVTGVWRGMPVIDIHLTADNAENLMAIRAAFNAMIEAKGYGPDANKK